MPLAEAPSMVISPDSFDPPLKRTKATVPGYWTVEELAVELGLHTRTVLYDITGNEKLQIKPKFQTAHKLGPYYLIPDNEALFYLSQRFKKNLHKK